MARRSDYTREDLNEMAISARTKAYAPRGIYQLSLTGKLDTVGVKSMPELADSLIENYLRGLRYE